MARGSRALGGPGSGCARRTVVGMFSPVGGLLSLLNLGLLVLSVWALVDAITRPAAAYVAAGKQTKPIWLAILGVAAALTLTGNAPVLGLFGIVVAVASIVYLVDVRPAVREMRPGNGPYGPYR